MKGQFIKATNSIKYLVVYLDRNLTFQEEVKHVLRKMAGGIKTIYSIRNYFPMKTCLLLLNALVISHLHYPAILLNGISENLMTTLEKQLNWAVKACFNRTKIESSSYLKTKHKILSVRYLLRARSTIYYWKYRKKLIPAFLNELKLPTDDVIEHKRTHSLALNYTPKSQFLYNCCFFKSIIPIWNTLPIKLETQNIVLDTAKHKIKSFFFERMERELDQSEYGKKCWRNYRFK